LRPLFGIDRLFSATLCSRGAAYFHQGKVDIFECAMDHVRARVQGTSDYAVEITQTAKGWKLACGCPYFEGFDVCKHLWAVVLATRERLGDIDVDPNNPGRLTSKPTVEQVRAKLEGVLANKLPRTGRPEDGWRRLLDELEEVARPDPEERDTVHVMYVLKIHGGRDSVFHELETLVASSASGMRRTAAFRPGALRRSDAWRLEPEDRRLLSILWGGTPAVTSRANEAASANWSIPIELQAVLLPQLARTGRLHLDLDRTPNTEPLQTDEGGPWEFVITLRRDGDEIALEGQVKRDDEAILLADCQAVLEGGVFIAKNRLSAVDWRGAWSWVLPLRRHGRVRVPDAHKLDVLDRIARAPADLRIDAEEFVEEVSGSPRGALRIQGARTGRQHLGAQIDFLYGDRRIEGMQEIQFQRDQDRIVRIVRDRDAEVALQDEFIAAGGQVAGRASFEASLVPIAGLSGLVERLTELGWLVEAEGKTVRSGASTSVSVRSGIDWFDVTAHVDFDGVSAEMPELLRALRERDGFVTLSDGSRGLLPEKWLASWNLGAALGDSEDGALRIPKGQAWLLDAWLAEHENVDVDAKFTNVRAALQRGITPAPRQEPALFVGELRGYQRDGLGWLNFLSEIGLGGCLADDMGLGKTVQVLALILERRAKARGPALVVAPRSLLFNWQREAERFAPTLNVKLHHGTGRTRKPGPLEDADLVVTSYGTLRNDATMLGKMALDVAVLDEAQAIKNEGSQAAKAARVLNADLRLALTGTPVENHLGELFSIFRFLNPALAKGSTHLRELMNGAKDDLETARVVARGMRPFLLRRTKEQVLTELPSKTEQVVSCELDGGDRKNYDELRKHYRNELLGKVEDVGLEHLQMNVLEALLRLRQAACHPGLIDPSRAHEGSAKLDALLPMLEEVRESGHKALVFSQFTSFLAIVRDRLDKQGVVYEYLDGKTRDREARVNRFQEDPSVSLFLISLKAGGVGLNLTSADYVFLLDPWWNPAVEQQAIDRTHRIGQTRPVTAYRLVARGTVEDKVLELQDRKRALAAALFESAGATLRDLTKEDLEWLLT
jgi:superfamily II DNA or RNA helicase